MRSLRIDIGMNAQQPFPGIFQLALHCAPHQFLDFRGESVLSIFIITVLMYHF